MATTSTSANKYEPQQTLLARVKTENRPLYDFLVNVDNLLSGGVGGTDTTTIIREGGGGGLIIPGNNTEVFFNDSKKLASDPGFTYVRGTSVSGPAFIAKTVFNSQGDVTVTGNVNVADTVVTWVSGTQFYSGMVGGNISIGSSLYGNALYTVAGVSSSTQLTLQEGAGTQNNVPYDFGNAFQTSNGTMAITGSGVGLFQQVIATNVFNSRGDYAVSGTCNVSGSSVTWVSGTQFDISMKGGNIAIGGVLFTIADVTDATHLGLAEPSQPQAGAQFIYGNAFQTSNGTMAITGSGVGLFQQLIVNTTFNSRADYSISGQVNVNDTVVTLISGTPFDVSMTGGNIAIGNLLFTVAGVNSTTQLVLEEGSPPQNNAQYIFGNAYQTSNGTMAITGSGVGLFQSLIANTVFNSRGDIAITGTVNVSDTVVTWVSGTQFDVSMTGGNIAVGDSLYTVAGVNSSTQLVLEEGAQPPTQNSVHYDFGNAFQTSGGTMAITGSGVGLFQQLICTTTFNSRSDISAAPATTASFQNSGGNFVIFGDGHAAFQNVAVTTYYAMEGQTTAPTMPPVLPPATQVAAIYYDQTGPSLLYNLNGAGWVPFAGAGSVAGSQTPWKQNIVAAGYNLTGAGSITGSSITTNQVTSNGQLFIATSNAPLPTPGLATLYFDGTDLFLSNGDKAFAPILTAGSVVTSIIAGTGILVDKTTGDVTVSANITAIQTPWLQNITAGGFNLVGAGSVTGSSITTNQTTVNGQLFIATSGAPLPTSGLATLYFDGTNLFLSNGSGPFSALVTAGNVVNSIIAGTGISVNRATGNVTVTASIASIQTPWLQNITGGGFNLINAGSITGSSITTNQVTSNGQMFFATSGAPLPTSGLATLYFNGTNLMLSNGSGAFSAILTSGTTVTSIIAGTGMTVNRATGDVTVTANIASIQTPWLQNITAGGFNLVNAGSITGSSITTNQTTVNGQLFIGTTGAPPSTSGFATLYFNGNNLMLSNGSGAFSPVATSGNLVTALYSGHGISLNGNTGAITVSTDSSVVTGVSATGSVTGSITSNVLYLTGTGVSAVTTTGPGTASIASGTLTINFPAAGASGVSAIYSGHGISLNSNTGAVTVSTDSSVVTGVLGTNQISASITSNVLYVSSVGATTGEIIFWNTLNNAQGHMTFTNGLCTNFYWS
jgi:hypothetical protein